MSKDDTPLDIPEELVAKSPRNYLHRPKLRRSLLHTDFNGKGLSITFEDDSFLKFENCFCEQEDQWLVVYTEHMGYHSFPVVSVRAIVKGK